MYTGQGSSCPNHCSAEEFPRRLLPRSLHGASTGLGGSTRSRLAWPGDTSGVKDEAEKQAWGWRLGAIVEFGESKAGLLPGELRCRNAATSWLLLSESLELRSRISQCRRRSAEQGKMGLAEEWGARSSLDTAGLFISAGAGAHSASLHVKDGCVRADQPRRFVPTADAERLHGHFPLSPFTHTFSF